MQENIAEHVSQTLIRAPQIEEELRRTRDLLAQKDSEHETLKKKVERHKAYFDYVREMEDGGSSTYVTLKLADPARVYPLLLLARKLRDDYNLAVLNDAQSDSELLNIVFGMAIEHILGVGQDFFVSHAAQGYYNGAFGG